MGTNTKERIATILRYSGHNAATFSVAINCKTKQAVYDLLHGKTKTVSDTMANKITSYLPEISRSWLLTGEGSMLRSQQGISQTLENVSKSVVGSRNRVVYGVDSSDGDCDWKARYEELEKRYNQLLEILGGK